VPPNFLDLKTKARDWLAVETGSIADTVLGDCLNLAIQDLARLHDLWLNEKTASFATGVVGQTDFAVPADFSRPYLFKYTNPSDGKIVYLKQKSFEEITVLYPDFGTALLVAGKPEHYTQFGALFSVAPPFDFAVATLSLNYYSVPADLTDGVNTNLFTQYAWPAVFFRALVYATRYLIEDPRKELWGELAREHELRLVIEHSRARHSGGRLVMEEPG
jgi:hypothetical protein